MKNIRVGVIGVGYLGRFHAQKYAALEDVELVGVADVNSEQCRFVAEECSCPSFADYKELLAALKPDAVLISTPHTLHFDQIMDSLDAGCHVHTEKPMVCTVDHAKKIIDKVKETGKHLMISYQRHFQPAYM